jgi:hypothetical protein
LWKEGQLQAGPVPTKRKRGRSRLTPRRPDSTGLQLFAGDDSTFTIRGVSALCIHWFSRLLVHAKAPLAC